MCYRCDFLKDRVGYKGQKYEVRFTRDGKGRSVGLAERVERWSCRHGEVDARHIKGESREGASCQFQELKLT